MGSPFSGGINIVDALKEVDPGLAAGILQTISPALSGGSGGRLGASAAQNKPQNVTKQAADTAAIGRQAQARRNAKGRVSGGGRSGGLGGGAAGGFFQEARRRLEQTRQEELFKERAKFEQSLAMETLSRQAQIQEQATRLEANLRQRDQQRKQLFIKSLLGSVGGGGGNLKSTSQQIVNVAGRPVTKTLEQSRQISPAEILSAIGGFNI